MSQTKYEKFDLTIEPRRDDGRYRVKVDTVLGQDSDHMRLPQSIADRREAVPALSQPGGCFTSFAMTDNLFLAR